MLDFFCKRLGFKRALIQTRTGLEHERSVKAVTSLKSFIIVTKKKSNVRRMNPNPIKLMDAE